MKEQEKRKSYVKPEIIYEMELETRAGSTPEVTFDEPFEISE
jgi:hypothetical protein